MSFLNSTQYDCIRKSEVTNTILTFEVAFIPIAVGLATALPTIRLAIAFADVEQLRPPTAFTSKVAISFD